MSVLYKASEVCSIRNGGTVFYLVIEVESLSFVRVVTNFCSKG